jgi:hypothetical protein
VDGNNFLEIFCQWTPFSSSCGLGPIIFFFSSNSQFPCWIVLSIIFSFGTSIQ